DVVDAVEADAAVVALDDLADEAREATLAELVGRDALRAVHRRRRDDVEDVLRIDLAVADRDEELLHVLDGERLHQLASLWIVLEQLRKGHARLWELALEELAAETKRLLALLGAEVVANLRARARGDDEVEPVLVRLLVRARDDLDDVAVAKLVAERLELAVH